MLLPLTVFLSSLQPKPVYLDSTKPFAIRAADLVGRMTLDEKVSQMVHGAKAIPRLGIPAYNWWNEALHGIARNGKGTVFPQPIGLGATFNPDLINTMAVAISDETRAKYHDQLRKTGSTSIYQGLTMWSPNINIFRDPRWGRGHETYGEDPFLTARMGVAFIKGMQGDDPKYLKTVATPKHYAVHSGPDPLRHTFNAVPTDYDLWNTYFPAFEACITEAKAWSIMSAYNRVNGAPASGSPFLLEQILRQRWGFKGYVVSDCGAIDDIYAGHKVVPTPAEASALAVNSGCDIECGGAYASLVDAVKKGLITEATIDKSLKRLMEARLRLGMFDPPEKVKYAKIPMSVVDSVSHRQLAQKLARESLVMLKNDGVLPLKKGIKTIAVVGPNANNPTAQWGNYNGIPTYTVTPLDGIKKLAGKGAKVLYAQGCGIMGYSEMNPIPADAIGGGFKREYYSNETLSGTPVTGFDKEINFDWGTHGMVAGQDNGYSIRWTATLKPKVSGSYTFAMKADDGMRLLVDGQKVLEDWREGAARQTTGSIELQAGKSYTLVAEYFERAGYASCQLTWSPPTSRKFAEALDAAEKSDVIVACMGLSPAQEDEEGDRTSIELPAVQNELLKALKATGKPVVLVLINGGPISTPWATQNVSAILESWYGGQEGGTGVAEALFGLLNPAGRLPVTIYHSTSELPDFKDYHMANRTYRYDARKPLYPFGYGLSYSKFTYDSWSGGKLVGGDLVGRVKVTNRSTRSGDEVVQLYLSHPAKGSAIRELRWFKRVTIPAGKSVWVDVRVPGKELRDRDGKGDLVRTAETVRESIGGGQPGTSGIGKPIEFTFKLPRK